ncbi:MAG: hypothetical protein R8K20_11255 [Gallionellaceae bacterium]
MARIRYIKPDFFLDEDLSDLPFETRLLFAGMWCHADREGRMEDRPRRIKAQIFPYDDVDIGASLDKLAHDNFIFRYSVNGKEYLQIVNFTKHQKIHHTERLSIIPAPVNGELTVKKLKCSAGMGNGKGNGKGKGISANAFTADDFNLFWTEFPNKKDKQKAFDAFKKINPNKVPLVIILNAVQAQIEWRRRLAASGDWVPPWKYGQGWINGKRWEDELSVDMKSGSREYSDMITPDEAVQSL